MKTPPYLMKLYSSLKIPPYFKELFSSFSFQTKRHILRLEAPAKEIELLNIKNFIQRVCDSAGCTTKEATSVILAVDEACTNIIRHAYTNIRNGKIELEVGIGLYDIRVKIIDHGKAFDFGSVKDPDLEHYVDIGKKGGWGSGSSEKSWTGSLTGPTGTATK